MGIVFSVIWCVVFFGGVLLWLYMIASNIVRSIKLRRLGKAGSGTQLGINGSYDFHDEARRLHEMAHNDAMQLHEMAHNDAMQAHTDFTNHIDMSNMGNPFM
ncbi:MAG: hypothetical protein IKK70_06325 [Clostridia bacterium]|nr:hypothetical protein [Clostridia bacterium]